MGSRSRQLLDLFEQCKLVQRDGGAETPHPLKCNDPLPVSSHVVKEAMRQLEMEFGGRGSTRVYGVPLNMGYCDVEAVWKAVENTDIVALGDDDADYCAAVRVFPYAHRVYSIWVFLVCITRE